MDLISLLGVDDARIVSILKRTKQENKVDASGDKIKSEKENDAKKDDQERTNANEIWGSFNDLGGYFLLFAWIESVIAVFIPSSYSTLFRSRHYSINFSWPI